MGKTGVTLIQLIIAIVIIGILAGISIPNFNKAKERVLLKEAIANLKLIAAAERMYRMDRSGYYPCTSTTDCNTNFRLNLNEKNWRYRVDADATGFDAYAERRGGNCTYKMSSDETKPSYYSGTCY